MDTEFNLDNLEKQLKERIAQGAWSEAKEVSRTLTEFSLCSDIARNRAIRLVLLSKILDCFYQCWQHPGSSTYRYLTKSIDQAFQQVLSDRRVRQIKAGVIRGYLLETASLFKRGAGNLHNYQLGSQLTIFLGRESRRVSHLITWEEPFFSRVCHYLWYLVISFDRIGWGYGLSPWRIVVAVPVLIALWIVLFFVFNADIPDTGLDVISALDTFIRLALSLPSVSQQDGLFALVIKVYPNLVLGIMIGAIASRIGALFDGRE